MEIDRHNKASDGDDDDDDEEWTDRRGVAGGDKTGCILATLPEDNVKTAQG